MSLFPVAYSELSQQNRVTFEGDSITGMECCNQVVEELCQIDVTPEDGVAFAASLRNLMIPQNSLNR